MCSRCRHKFLSQFDTGISVHCPLSPFCRIGDRHTIHHLRASRSHVLLTSSFLIEGIVCSAKQMIANPMIYQAAWDPERFKLEIRSEHEPYEFDCTYQKCAWLQHVCVNERKSDNLHLDFFQLVLWTFSADFTHLRCHAFLYCIHICYMSK